MQNINSLLNPITVMFKIVNKIKKKALIKKFKNVGSLELNINKQHIHTPHLIEIGEDVFFGDDIYISAEVSIGDRVMFGPYCLINGGDHIFGIIGKHPRFLKPVGRENSKKINIEEDVWCGARVVILKGINIGKGAVIGAGSVVTKNIPPYTIAVGNPCRPIKKVFADNELAKHLKILGYDQNIIDNVIKERNEIFNND